MLHSESRLITHRWLGAFLVFVLLVAAPSLAQDSEDPGLGEFLRRFQTDRSYVQRFHNLPWAEERFDRLDRLHREWQARFEKLDFDGLGIAGRIDWLLFRGYLDLQRSRAVLERQRLAEMDDLLPGRRMLLDLEIQRRQAVKVDFPAVAAKLAALPDEIKVLRERIEKGRSAKSESKPASNPAESQPDVSTTSSPAGPLTVTPVIAARAAGALGELQRLLNSWADEYQSYDPEFAWWMKQPREAASKALDDYARYLRETIAGLHNAPEDPLIGDPIGETALLGDLAAEMLAYSPQDLIAIAEREFAWCDAEMKKAAAEMGFGDDWKAALAKVKQDYVRPGEQDRLVADEARGAMQFLKDHDLVTLPPEVEEMWRCDMLTPDQQKYWPFQVYLGQSVGVSYPTASMSNEDKLMALRGNNRHFTHIVVQHELVPGHHLQGFMSERYRAYREMFGTPFFVEAGRFTGDADVGARLRARARRSHRHALLADAPLRALSSA